MPGIIASLIGAGLVVAGIGRRGLALCLDRASHRDRRAGRARRLLVWGYDYGHDLDPTAAIKIPGLSYQPPLLGSKQLLNFTAHLLARLGGWAIVAALTTGLVLCVLELPPASAVGSAAAGGVTMRRSTIRRRGRIGALLLALVVPACSAPAPGVIHYDVDACDRCRMTISDPSFAAQLVMRTGKVYRFDDPGCLLSFMASGSRGATPTSTRHG